MNSGNLKISHVTDVWVSMASQIPGIGTQVTASYFLGKEKTCVEGWFFAALPKNRQNFAFIGMLCSQKG